MAIEDKSKAQLLDQLAEERQLMRNLIDSLPDGIYVKDTESRFVLGNTTVARLIGVASPDELIGKTDFDFFSHELASKYYEDEQAIMRSEVPLVNQEEPTFDSRTNKTGWLLTSKVIWRDRGGKVAGIMGIGRNITELKQAQEALAQAHHELEQRVQDRTLELTQSKAKLERVFEFYRSSLEQLTNVVHQGGLRNELLMYLGQVQTQFDHLS
jgi:PAS domain S-box-containing protein